MVVELMVEEVVGQVIQLHKLETIETKERGKKQKNAWIHLNVHASLASRLGIFWIKSEFEDRAFQILQPEEYSKLKKLVSQKEINLPIKVAAASFTDLNKTKLILTKENREKFIFLGSEKKEAEYVFTNYYYHVPPKIDKRYEIPENFNSLIKLNIKGLLINEIFKKR